MTTNNGHHCWKCGASIDEEPLPLSRTAECKTCRSDLHVCMLCIFYDTKVSKACREPIADLVRDKTRNNFCGYFQPNPNPPMLQSTAHANVRSAAEALFGGTSKPGVEPSAVRKSFDDLFK